MHKFLTGRKRAGKLKKNLFYKKLFHWHKDVVEDSSSWPEIKHIPCILHIYFIKVLTHLTLFWLFNWLTCLNLSQFMLTYLAYLIGFNLI